MAQILFYIEVQTFNADGTLFDVHLSHSGGLPMLYLNEKKAINRISRMRDAFLMQGYQLLSSDALPSLWLKHATTGAKIHICLREVRVLT